MQSATHGGLDHGALHIGSSDLHGGIICDEKDLAELYISTLGIGEPLHKDLVASLYFKLLACNVYDCVHRVKLVKSFGRKRLPFRQLFINGLAVINCILGCEFTQNSPLRQIILSFSVFLHPNIIVTNFASWTVCSLTTNL